MNKKANQKFHLFILVILMGACLAVSHATTLSTWVSGSNTTDDTGVYGTKGVSDTANVPGARNESISWTDSSGNLWLFGGWGFAWGAGSELNDLWKFDGTNWTWVSGSDEIPYTGGVYGTKGVPESNNVPGARAQSGSWIDSSDNLWLFGGVGLDSSGAHDPLNDLWKFDGTNWTWVSGSDKGSQAGVYGEKGVTDPNNPDIVPGARNGSITWTDSSDTLWLFGGGGFNDLWKFDGTDWTWVSGSKNLNQPGVYGTKGVADPNNVPGTRDSGVTWIDSTDSLWLFGGWGYDSNGSGGLLNDLWKFDGSDWTWVGGSNSADQPGVYGIKGVASAANVPGARTESIAWIDSSGTFWLFGGMVIDSSGTWWNRLNDLWKFDGMDWTWVGGSNIADQPGVYGAKGVASAENFPGSRDTSISWIDSSDNLWLFGGNGVDSVNVSSNLNDLWKIQVRDMTIPPDFNADRMTDLLWRRSDDYCYVRLMNGVTQTTGFEYVGGKSTMSLKGLADFNGDGKTDTLWGRSDGFNYVRLMNGVTPTTGYTFVANSTMTPQGTADFNGDGKADILWQRNDGYYYVRLMDGVTPTTGYKFVGNASMEPKGLADFNADGKADILWRRSDGYCYVRLMDGGTPTTGFIYIGGNTNMELAGLGDFNGDGKADILWRRSDGFDYVRLMDGVTPTTGIEFVGNSNMEPRLLGDFNGDGKSDILWQRYDGYNYVRLMDGVTPTTGYKFVGNTQMTPQGLGDFNGDGKADILWQRFDDYYYVRLMDGVTPTTGYSYVGSPTMAPQGLNVLGLLPQY
jgi:N-acetylneuraminic acid mutarotase